AHLLHHQAPRGSIMWKGTGALHAVSRTSHGSILHRSNATHGRAGASFSGDGGSTRGAQVDGSGLHPYLRLLKTDRGDSTWMRRIRAVFSAFWSLRPPSAAHSLVRLRYCTFVGSSLSLKIHWRESLEMLWPAFNELGDLPIGVYRATLAEVIAHFGHGTPQRVTITARLERIYELAHRTASVQRFIIFGSYVTAEPN